MIFFFFFDTKVYFGVQLVAEVIYSQVLMEFKQQNYFVYYNTANRVIIISYSIMFIEQITFFSFCKFWLPYLSA